MLPLDQSHHSTNVYNGQWCIGLDRGMIFDDYPFTILSGADSSKNHPLLDHQAPKLARKLLRDYSYGKSRKPLEISMAAIFFKMAAISYIRKTFHAI